MSASMTFVEIGRELGISGEAAGRIFARAILKMQIAEGVIPAPTGRTTSTDQRIWTHNWQVRNRKRYLAYKREWNRKKREAVHA